ncbi:type II toxin-antitoxin system HicB family antitoxin [Desulfosarcina ovata]|uniref:type II toxin-antitoxin system HicB family antitoxin n=1 Tax=Desulfosarcina ovata TaxID=83564 RepID=UPI0012D2EAA2|nr:type II toxin-antitoxin system HicB family antitoxin [Desulfosarcina ovata]
MTAGANIDEAKDMAQNALTLHIQGMLEDGEPLPAPSKLEEIMADPDVSDAAAFLVVGVPDAKPRTIRVNITVPDVRNQSVAWSIHSMFFQCSSRFYRQFRFREWFLKKNKLLIQNSP